MSLPRFSVKKPIFTTMVVLMVVVLGLVSFSRLRIDLLPSVELPTLSVRTSYDGASPVVMEQMVTQIVEEILATVPGIVEMTSQSEEGSSRVRLTFDWNTDIDTAAAEVRAKLEDEINELPEDIERPRISIFDIDSAPVVIIGVSSDLDPIALTELTANEIRYRFARIPGVAQVDLFGGFYREIRVELDASRIKALGISLDRILNALRDANLDLPAGKIESGQFEVTLRSPAEFKTVDEIKDTAIGTFQGSTIRLQQIATVRDTFQKRSRIERINGERGIRVGIRKEAEANTVEVSKAILSEIDEINRDFPQAEVLAVINQGNFIERSIANVARSVLYGSGLAVLVLLFFLRNLRSTAVIALSIPISIIATFALIYFAGFTINLMTLGGLALGVGMMVDSSIVALENIFRHRNDYNKAPEEAAIDGANEVAGAIIASTITTLVIFLPIVFLKGVSGVLFKELAFVIVFSLVCSLFVSLSIVPMLASKLLKPETEDSQKDTAPGLLRRLMDGSEGGLKWIEETYAWVLKGVLKNRYKTAFSAFGLFALSLLLIPLVGTELMPPSDEGAVRVDGEMDIGTRIDLVDAQAKKMEAIVRAAVPEAVASVTRVSEGNGRIQLSLTPALERSRSNSEIAEDLREKLEGQIPGMELRVRAPQGQFLLARLLGGDEGLTIEARGYELKVLDALAREAANLLRGIEGITDVRMSEDIGIPQEEIRVDREKIASLGLSPRDVASVLRTAVAGSRAGEFRPEGNSYGILVQLAEAENLSIEEVLDLTLSVPSGDAVALRNIVSVVSSRGPIEINRKDQQRLITVNANVAGRDIGSIAEEVDQKLDLIPRPDGYNLLVAGNFEEQQKAFNDLAISLLLALVLVYMVLACQYESLRDPVIVMIATPMAAIGVLLTLFITETTLNLQSYIGCIMLGGIVVNNAILLVDQASRLKEEGYTILDAVTEAGRRRIRPILMTTLTTILGLLPLAFGIGEGADAQAPLARAVVGGLAASTLITLLLIPVMYSLFHDEKKPEQLA